jgi:hypothetical protein
MTPLDPGHLNMRSRRLILPLSSGQITHTHRMLAASAVAAIIIIGFAGMLMSMIM